MERKGVIYKIENLVNGKVYIGQTVQSPKRRESAHKRNLRKGIHDNDFLQKAWNKYGEENFKFSIVEKCTESNIDNLEVKWINFYRNKNVSYNLESGGKTNKKIHKSTKEKMSKITKSHGWIGGKHPCAKKVICINTGKIYSSVIEASNDIGCNYDNVHQVCLGNNLSAKGIDGNYYQFSYYNKGEIYKLKQLKNIKEPKKVICINTKEIFSSTQEASKATGALQSKISLACNGKRKHAGRMPNGDYIAWEFLDNYDINKKYSFSKGHKKITNNNQ